MGPKGGAERQSRSRIPKLTPPPPQHPPAVLMKTIHALVPARTHDSVLKNAAQAAARPLPVPSADASHPGFKSGEGKGLAPPASSPSPAAEGPEPQAQNYGLRIVFR